MKTVGVVKWIGLRNTEVVLSVMPKVFIPEGGRLLVRILYHLNRIFSTVIMTMIKTQFMAIRLF